MKFCVSISAMTMSSLVKQLIVIDNSEKLNLIREAHIDSDNNHYGTRITYNYLRSKFEWLHQFDEVRKFVINCECNRNIKQKINSRELTKTQVNHTNEDLNIVQIDNQIRIAQVYEKINENQTKFILRKQIPEKLRERDNTTTRECFVRIRDIMK